MIGERPPSPNLDWGWWDSAIFPNNPASLRGQAYWDMDVCIGVLEQIYSSLGGNNYSGPGWTGQNGLVGDPCPSVSSFHPPGPPATNGDWQTRSNFCDFYHFWSNHTSGAFFAFCDGSVQFLTYGAAPIMPALATRAGGETPELP
jgi:hypothetical protein